MTEETKKRASLSERLKSTLAEYGGVAIGVYATLSVLVFLSAAAALKMGLSFDGVSGGVGTLAGAWVLLKITQPVRIIVVLASTPIVAKLLGRSKKTPEDDAPDPA